MFEFDERKSETNKLKHGINFHEAIALWEKPVVEIPTYPGTDEQRTLVLGTIDEKHWSAIITERAGNMRIISVRRSRKEEVETYEQCQREQN